MCDPEEALSDVAREALSEFGWDIPPDLGGLEVGVAGLSHALNAVGIATAASCRGHTASTAWSKAPVVFFAAERAAAISLQRLVSRTGCTFVSDEARPELLVVRGRTITHVLALADLVILEAETFR